MSQFIPIETVIARLGGKPAEAARAVGITPQAINKWIKSRRVPIERVSLVSEKTGIPRHELRPDIFNEVPQP